MASEIRVLLVESLEKPRLVTIEHTLEKLQELVGGNIQCVYPWDDAVGLVCCDTGKIDGFLPNRLLEDYDLICGNFFICGLGREDFTDISDELAEKYEKKFHFPELFFKADGSHVVRVKVGSPEKPKVVI